MKKNTKDGFGAPATREYEIGYGKPPMHSRFKRGQSGNPKGRRKGSKSSGSIFQKIQNQMTAIREGDQIRTVSKDEAVFHSLWRAAMKGNPNAIQTWLELKEANHLSDSSDPYRFEVIFVSANREKNDS